MAKLEGFNKVAIVELHGSDCYFALYNDDIQVGDNVLVSKNYFLFAKVNRIISLTEAKRIKPYSNINDEVICKVDTSEYDKRVEIRKKQEELKKKMEKRKKELKAFNEDEYYSSVDVTYSQLYEEYKKIKMEV